MRYNHFPMPIESDFATEDDYLEEMDRWEAAEQVWEDEFIERSRMRSDE